MGIVIISIYEYFKTRYWIFIRGLLSYFPFALKIIGIGSGKIGTGGTNSARYCYGVWLRHLILLHKNGLKDIPKSVAEIGPGDSLGIGLSAMLSGTNTYFAFDIIKHANNTNNAKIFKQLIEMFKQKENIPGNDEFPNIKPVLENYEFPTIILTPIIKESLSKNRLDDIENSITKEVNNSKIRISYIVPWTKKNLIKHNYFDLIYSQAVMEHVLNVEEAYHTMFRSLKPGGFISHDIDYQAHETHRLWHGHWTYSKLIWRIILHGRSYPINRLSHQEHLKLMRRAGFKIVYVQENKSDFIVPKKHLALQYKNLSKNDLMVKTAYIIAQKPKIN